MDSYLGQILLVAFNYAPYNYALCQGQLLSISSNYALFAVIGTQFGGDGRTTFALPDLRGRVPVGFGQRPSSSAYVVGEQGGMELTTLGTPNLPAGMGVTSKPSIPVPAGGAPTDPMVSSSMAFGGGLPFSNMQPYLVLNYIICVNGIFPSRP